MAINVQEERKYCNYIFLFFENKKIDRMIDKGGAISSQEP